MVELVGSSAVRSLCSSSFLFSAPRPLLPFGEAVSNSVSVRHGSPTKPFRIELQPTQREREREKERRGRETRISCLAMSGAS